MRCEGELRKRMTVHRQQIRNPELIMTPLSEHLSKCAKSSSKKFSVFPFYKFPEEAKEQQRIIKEAEFISKYKPKLNKYCKPTNFPRAINFRDFRVYLKLAKFNIR